MHATCVALGTNAALLRGPSGAGKSDLALRFIALGGDDGAATRLVGDDQVWVEARGAGVLMVFPPVPLAGKLEVRGLGIVETMYVPAARLVLVVDLVDPGAMPRMPPKPLPRAVIAGTPVPLLQLAPFELSAPLKLKLALGAELS